MLAYPSSDVSLSMGVVSALLGLAFVLQFFFQETKAIASGAPRGH